MNYEKNFFANITRAGWIVISLVIVLMVLVIAGILLAKNNFWPFASDGDTGGELTLDVDNDFVNQAAATALSIGDVLGDEYDNSPEAATAYIQNTTPVRVAVIAKGVFDGSKIVDNECGNIIFATVRVPKKPAILNETLIAMFEDKVATDVLPGNVVPQNTELLFERAVLEDDEALIFLNGSLSGDRCQIKNTLTQIKLTALNFDTINSTAVFLNGKEI